MMEQSWAIVAGKVNQTLEFDGQGDHVIVTVDRCIAKREGWRGGDIPERYWSAIAEQGVH